MKVGMRVNKVNFKGVEFERLFILPSEKEAKLPLVEYALLQFRNIPFEVTAQIIAELSQKTKVLGIYVGTKKKYVIIKSTDDRFKVGEELEHKVGVGGTLTTVPPKAPHLILKRNKKIFYLSFSTNEAMKKAWNRAMKNNGLIKVNKLYYTVVDGVEWG